MSSRKRRLSWRLYRSRLPGRPRSGSRTGTCSRRETGGPRRTCNRDDHRIHAGAAAATPAVVSPAAKPAAPVVAAPAAVTAPTPAPSPAPAKAAAGSDDVVKAVSAWAEAWSRKDMRGYFNAYASNFDTPNGVSRKAWEKERQQRIAGKGGKISVTFDDPQVTINGDKATAKFRQHYNAPGLSSSTTKTLVFVRSGSKWLIKEENAR
jgi:ketosteroid isomerase-like protein